MIAQATVATPPRRQILGQRVDDLSWEDCLALLGRWSQDPLDRPCRQVITLNPEHVMAARRDARFHRAIEAADLVTCDGVGLAWAGRILGQPLRAIIPGSELITRLSDSAGGAALRYFLLGGGPGVAPAAAQNLKIRHPRVIVVGTHGGSPRLEDLPEILAALHAAAPIDVLWVAYGSPAQELWIARHQSLLPTKLAIGVGGTFDFMAGVAMPPPLWAQRAGLIWLFRLLREPWRWRRQQVLLPFMGLVLLQALRRRLSNPRLNTP